mgnify:CR=1 FL=1
MAPPRWLHSSMATSRPPPRAPPVRQRPPPLRLLPRRPAQLVQPLGDQLRAAVQLQRLAQLEQEPPFVYFDRGQAALRQGNVVWIGIEPDVATSGSLSSQAGSLFSTTVPLSSMSR